MWRMAHLGDLRRFAQPSFRCSVVVMPKNVRIKPESTEVAEFVTSAVTVMTANLPLVYDPISYTIATASGFLAQRLARWGGEFQDFLKSPQAKSEGLEEAYIRWLESLKILHKKDVLDDELLDALRNIHILSTANDTTKEETTELYMLLDIARQLSGVEVLTILAAYKIHRGMYSDEEMQTILRDGQGPETAYASRWRQIIMCACQFSTPDYIHRYEDHLEQLRLIAPRDYNQHCVDGKGNDFMPTKWFRLTWAGYKLADLCVRGGELYESVARKSKLAQEAARPK